MFTDENARNQEYVQQHRRQRAWSEARAGVEQARQHRHQADEEQVGKGHPAEEHRQLELARNMRVLARQQPDDPRHEQPVAPLQGPARVRLRQFDAARADGVRVVRGAPGFERER